jgi:hypothetical protein
MRTEESNQTGRVFYHHREDRFKVKKRKPIISKKREKERDTSLRESFVSNPVGD